MPDYKQLVIYAYHCFTGLLKFLLKVFIIVLAIYLMQTSTWLWSFLVLLIFTF